MTGFSNIGKASGFAGINPETGLPEGDLTGSYPNPLVKGLWDHAIDPRDPQEGDSIIFTGGEWVPTPSPAAVTYFQGPWDASTNTPDVLNYPGLTDGYVWIVTVPGNTLLGGIGDWHLGDYALYSNGSWYKLSNNAFGWGLAGNSGTQANVNYIGTNDDEDFVVRTNDSEVLRIYTGTGARLSGSLTTTENVTVEGGTISTTASTFNLLNTVASVINFAGSVSSLNIGKSTGTNIISGSTILPQGMSGSLTQLPDGTSYMIAAKGMIILSSSNGPVTLAVNDSIFATLSGSSFSGPVIFNAGLSGSLTKLADGTSYILGATNTLVTTGSNGSITVSTPAAGLDTQVQFNDGGTQFGANSGLTYNKATNSLTVSGNEAIDGGNLTTMATTFNLLNTTATTVNFAGGASTATNIGNTSAVNTFSGTTKFPQGISGSLTKLTDGTSAFIAGQNIAITSASNGPVTVAFSTTTPATGNILSYDGTAWGPSNVIDTLQVSYQTVRAQGNIAAGDVCYIVNAGGSNAYPTVAKAQANSVATCKGVIGLATGSIAANTLGTVQTYGQLPGPVDTNNFSQGAPLYVSPTTPGAVTDVKPSGPNIAFQVGFVTRQGQPQNVTTGIVFVSPMQETNTQNIHDFVFTTPAEHDVLTYEAGSLQWKNKQTLWVPNTQNSLAVDNNTIITAANFLNVVYLPLTTQGGANKTLNATTPIERLAKTNVDYGRELWLHNVDNNKTITIPAGGSVKLDGGVSLVLAAGAMAKFMWSGYGGGNGFWIQTSKALTVA